MVVGGNGGRERSKRYRDWPRIRSNRGLYAHKVYLLLHVHMCEGRCVCVCVCVCVSKVGGRDEMMDKNCGWEEIS